MKRVYSRRVFVAASSAAAPIFLSRPLMTLPALLPGSETAGARKNDNELREERMAAETDATRGAVIHMFAFRWKPGITEEQKNHAMAEIKALQGQIPGLLETFVGANFSPRSQGYALGGVMRFADRAALEAYPSHPVHKKLIAWLMPLIEPVEVDFQSI
jgi:stress responsive alpha/beta barrel protein